MITRFIKIIWHDPVGSNVIAAIIIATPAYIINILSILKNTNKTILQSIKESFTGKIEISNALYYILIVLSVFCLIMLVRYLQIKYFSDRKRELASEISSNIADRKSAPNNDVKTIVDGLYLKKEDAISRTKVMVDTFRYNWQGEVFNSNGDVNYGKKMIDELERDLRELRDKVNPENNFQVKEYISEILKRVQNCKNIISPMLVGFGDPDMIQRFWKSGMEVITLLERLENSIK